ncbi:MAG: MCP four helix bundle domain-containing protein, partial [Anaerolineaceae bacterium]|nr:MCP four helix bundle domain-containing protein [Anaerolineaceae bacterium]
MNIFKNFSVGTKILAGNFIALALMIVVGGVAIVQLNTIDSTVSDLANSLAVDQHLADQIESKILLVRFYANKYIRDQKSEDLTHYQEALTGIETLLTEADTKIIKPQRVEMLHQVETGVQTYKSTFAEVTQLIADREQTVSTILDIEGPLAQQKLDQLAQVAFDDSDFEVAYHSLKANEALELMRLNAFRYLEHGDESWLVKFEEHHTEAKAAFDSIKINRQNANWRELIAEAAAAVEHYAEGFATLHSDYSHQNELIETQLNVVGPQIRQTAADISASVQADFQAQNAATTSFV